MSEVSEGEEREKGRGEEERRRGEKGAGGRRERGEGRWGE